MDLGQAQLGDVQRRYVEAPVQGKAQTCEQQTCLGLASLGFEPCVAYGSSCDASSWLGLELGLGLGPGLGLGLGVRLGLGLGLELRALLGAL